MLVYCMWYIAYSRSLGVGYAGRRVMGTYQCVVDKGDKSAGRLTKYPSVCLQAGIGQTSTHNVQGKKIIRN